ncbi:MAG: response regulator [Candidatus Aenigmatarchaeota archaeon]
MSKNIRVLIIEDNELNAIVLKEMLDIIGDKLNINFEVIEADNLEDAFAIIKEGNLDLILSDIELPDGSGEKIIKILEDLSLEIPVIAVTAFGLVGDKERFLFKGFNDYISKPISLDEFMEVVKKYV